MFDLFRSDWGAAPPARSYVTIAWNARPGVETHHSVGLYGTTRAGSWMKTMQRDHLSRGWTDVFYGVGIYTDGVIVEGRPTSAQSGPIKDLTVCFAGDYRTRQLTDAQKQSWHKVRNHALAQGVGTRIVWHGLRGGSSCPGTNVINWLKTLDEEAEVKPPSWAVPATQWHIDKGIYSESRVEDVDEDKEFHRQTVFRHRFYQKVVAPAQGGAHDHDGRYIKNIIVSR